METLAHESSTQQRSNPFPGLRPFHREEKDLYFGRDNQVKEVLDKLMRHRFVAIIGVSGIGKSSFIYCGILPKLEEAQESLEGLTYNSGQWATLSLKPGSLPFTHLVQQVKAFSQSDSEIPDDQPETGLDAFSAYNLDWFLDQFKQRKAADSLNSPNYLLFIDQFEEVFSLQKQKNPEEARHFIHIIQALVNQTEVPIYVAITMRSDFIGHCSQYPGFTEMINGSQFLIPYMTRQEKEAAIRQPILKSGGRITDDLVNRILQDVGNKLDQLPLMQHALMRTWDAWEKSGEAMMDEHHYDKIGGITDGLSRHADEVFKTLKANQVIACAKVFKAITKGNLRQPTPLGKIAEIVSIPISEVKDIVEHFRRQECGLLMPPPTTLLDHNSIIDISHESLISNWENLKTWAQEEDESVRTFLRLDESARLHQGKDTLME
ncbi:MAG: High-affnity carbon uptake protein Hat/HatR, partial [Bacteroidota bacterium]